MLTMDCEFLSICVFLQHIREHSWLSMHMHPNEHSCTCWKFMLERGTWTFCGHLYAKNRDIYRNKIRPRVAFGLPPPFSKHFLSANMPRRTSVILEWSFVLDVCSNERKRHELCTVCFVCPSLQRICRKCKKIEQEMQERKKRTKINIWQLQQVGISTTALYQWNDSVICLWFILVLEKVPLINNVKIYRQTW